MQRRCVLRVAQSVSLRLHTRHFATALTRLPRGSFASQWRPHRTLGTPLACSALTRSSLLSDCRGVASKAPRRRAPPRGQRTAPTAKSRIKQKAKQGKTKKTARVARQKRGWRSSGSRTPPAWRHNGRSTPPKKKNKSNSGGKRKLSAHAVQRIKYNKRVNAIAQLWKEQNQPVPPLTPPPLPRG